MISHIILFNFIPGGASKYLLYGGGGLEMSTLPTPKYIETMRDIKTYSKANLLIFKIQED